MNKLIVLLALTATACSPHLKVQEQIGPISGHLIRSIEGPIDEAGGVRVSGIQTFSREMVVARAVGGSSYCGGTRTVRKKLCDGRVVTRRVSTPQIVYQEGGWKMQDSSFGSGPGTLQTVVGSAIQAAGFAGGMYLGRPPKIDGDNISITQQGATSTGGQGGQATAAATGGTGGRGGTGGMGGMGGTGGIGIGGSAVASSTSRATASTKSLNQQSYEFHVKNPMREHKQPVYHKPKHKAHDDKPKHHDKHKSY